jgi:amino acid permease
VRIAVLLAALVGAGDLIDVIAGGRFTVGRSHAGVVGVLVFSILMLLCAVGMWRLRYWAVLSFQAILAIVIMIFSLLLIRASSVLGLVVGLVVVGGGGVLFYKLVRTLSRIQVPRSPGT